MSNLNKIKLTICIPTFNRGALATELVQTALLCPHVKVMVYIDGSVDETGNSLSSVQNSRLKIVQSFTNRGRGPAIVELVSKVDTEWLMLFDDDDLLDIDGLVSVTRLLEEFNKGLPELLVFPMLGSTTFEGIGCCYSNYFALRYDLGLKNDAKEIVKTDCVQAFIDKVQRWNERRIPTGILLRYVALTCDALFYDIPLGEKRYLENGMSSKINVLKMNSPKGMKEYHRLNCLGFVRGRYRCVSIFFRSVIGFLYYSGCVLILR